MLVTLWIKDALQKPYSTFDHINNYAAQQSMAMGIETSPAEVKAALDKLIEQNIVETHQYLAEEKYYAETIYDKSNIYWYFFKLKGPN